MSNRGQAGPDPDTRGADLPGGTLGEVFHRELVGPLIQREMPTLRYAAARLGSGSDVLGFDDSMSRDHDWGCRLTLLVDEADRKAVPLVEESLARLLPQRFRGLPVRFATTWDPAVSHRVQVATVGDFAVSRLGVDPLHGLSALDWLTLTGQSVLEVTADPVYHDTTTELAALRRVLIWFPSDVERFVLASGWQRLAQRMPLIGRTAQTGQALQSRLLSVALVHDLMGLAFLLHQRWPPYVKWREAAFTALPSAPALTPALEAAVTASHWEDREASLAAAVETLLAVQRSRGLPTPTASVTPFWDRPYRTVADAVPALLLADINDPTLLRLPFTVGNIEQWIDNFDVLAHPSRRSVLTCAYQAWTADTG